MKEHYLKEIDGFDRDIAKELGKYWINTAEKLVSMTCTPKWLHSWADAIGVSDEELNKYRLLARSHVSPARLKDIESTYSIGDYSFGYRLEKKKK